LRALGFEPKKEELKKLVWLELILVCNISMKWWSDVSDGYLLDISWLTPTRDILNPRKWEISFQRAAIACESQTNKKCEWNTTGHRNIYIYNMYTYCIS
jgi:hypothetical protein